MSNVRRSDAPEALEKRGGYSGSKPGKTMGPPRKIPSGAITKPAGKESK